MEWLLPAVTANLISSVILFLVYANIYNQEQKNYLASWTKSWGLYALRFVFLLCLLTLSNHRIFLISNQLSSMWSGYFLLLGTNQFVKLPTSRWWLAGAVANSFWIFVATLGDAPFLWLTIPTFSFMALVNIWAGTNFFRFKGSPGLGAKVVGVSFILWGLHKFNYPFLQPLKWLAPWGYLLGAVLALIISVVIILVYYQKTKEELRQSEERNRQILMTSVDGYCRSDMEGRLVEVNDAYCRMLGYDKQELLGMNVADLQTPEDSKNIPSRVNCFVQNGFDRFESCHRRKDGSLLDLDISVQYIGSGKDEGCVAFLRDITRRKQAEKVEKANYLRQRIAMELAHLVHWEYDFDSDLFHFDEQFYALYGTSESEQGGTQMSSAEYAKRFLYPEDAPLVVREIHKAIEATDPNFKHEVEHRIIRADGRERVINVRFGIVKDETGRTVKAYGANQDITDKKRAEREREELKSQLVQAQKMEAVGTLAGGIAHDFNNILGAILGYAEIAQEDACTGRVDPEDLEQIIAATQRAKDLVTRILTFSRKNKPRLQPINPNPVIKKTKSILERTLPKMIVIELDLDGGVPHTLVDPTQMEQVLLNLSSNAADAMPEGGRLGLATRILNADSEFLAMHPEIPSGEYVKVSISDTGCGMVSSTRDHMFEPFFTTKAVGKGTGLGLSTVYGIVESHGGFIYCDSEPGRGTTFDIYLPAIKESTPTYTTGETEVDNAGPPGHETILVVDDESALRDIAGRILSKAGYRVMKASSGEEAIKAYAAQPTAVDLVLLDLNMPGMGGVKALDALKEINSDAKVLIASGYSHESREKDSIGDGASGFVDKPYKKQELLTTIRHILD